MNQNEASQVSAFSCACIACQVADDGRLIQPPLGVHGQDHIGVERKVVAHRELDALAQRPADLVLRQQVALGVVADQRTRSHGAWQLMRLATPKRPAMPPLMPRTPHRFVLITLNPAVTPPLAALLGVLAGR
jgi:hypothetical protein